MMGSGVRVEVEQDDGEARKWRQQRCKILGLEVLGLRR